MDIEIQKRLCSVARMGMLAHSTKRMALQMIEQLKTGPFLTDSLVIWHKISRICSVKITTYNGKFMRVDAESPRLIYVAAVNISNENVYLRKDIIKLFPLCRCKNSYRPEELQNSDIMQKLNEQGIYTIGNKLTTCSLDQYIRMMEYCDQLPINIQKQAIDVFEKGLDLNRTISEMCCIVKELVEAVSFDSELLKILPMIYRICAIMVYGNSV